MPYFGLLLFLQKGIQPVVLQGKCVNALLRATPISTKGKEILKREEELCQCPTSGYSYFYEVQKLLKVYSKTEVSMPYFGLLLFLQVKKIEQEEQKKIVSMPYFGLLLFLLSLFQPRINSLFPVSFLQIFIRIF